MFCILNLLIGSTLPNDYQSKKNDQGFISFTKSYMNHTMELLKKKDLKRVKKEKKKEKTIVNFVLLFAIFFL